MAFSSSWPPTQHWGARRRRACYPAYNILERESMRRRQFLMNAVGATAGTLTAGAMGGASAMVPEAAGAWAVPPGTGPISARPSEPVASQLQHPAVAPMAVGLFVRLENNPE